MRKITSILFILFTGIIITTLIKATEPTKKTAEHYQIKAIKTQTNLSFAGETIPLHINDVKERVDREILANTYFQSNSLLLIKRAHKFFPIIEPILAEYGVPNDFKYLAVAESSLRNVVSTAGARGFWQLMKQTGKDFGLEVNDNVDERYHLEKSTRVACNYLLQAKKKFGNWTDAAASYNLGMAGLQRRFDKQLVNSYYDALLPEETMRYIPRIMAYKSIISNPADFGFEFDKEDLYVYPNYNIIKLDTAIANIAEFAQQHHTNYKKLKNLNPWLRENKLNNGSRILYTFKIPVE